MCWIGLRVVEDTEVYGIIGFVAVILDGSEWRMRRSWICDVADNVLDC